ncbi:MAG TPA: threonine ammonia-lyase, biosynthetic [Gammaproteobacteria bacterium]|nr:threonine ammonia-lyase, biosynthetic [Gammaproteobacteria bacterium]
MNPDYPKMIKGARVYDVARETPLDRLPEISRRLENEIWLKREDLQPVFSYKLRGAYNLMASLPADQRARGVITASAGNHAQGVALAAQKMGVPALIVMPKTTPEIKVAAVRRLGADILLHGNTYDEASEHAHKLAQERALSYIPPYDHPLVIAGQGTVAMEILRQHPQPIDAVFVPVGGGGLIAGVAAYVKSVSPQTRVIGVESDEAPTLHAAMRAGKRVVLEHIGIFVDGAAVRQIGEETFRVARELVDEVLLVSNDEVCAAIKDIFEDTRSIAEPAGALALAGLKQYVAASGARGRELVAIFSGANVNFDRLRHIAELAELGEQREALLGVTIPERAGSFRRFCEALGARAITEFNYRYSDPKVAHVFVGVRIRHGVEEKDQLIETLRGEGYEVADFSADEMAKMHVRYMVGGHGRQVENERLYRFEFPERTGALLHFLTEMGSRWNISLFHYRNHGAAYGRVLMGMQVPPKEQNEFEAFLKGLGMNHAEETRNPAYQMFLR